MGAEPAVLLTGATGFLGREVLARLLTAGRPVLATTRARPGETPEDGHARLCDIVRRTDPEAPLDGLRVAFADVTAAGLGLDAAAEGWLAEHPSVALIHGAAEVRFDLPLAEMRRQNVEGTRHVLDLATRLADQGRLARVDHVSTAYVAGDRTDRALESEGDVGQGPRNAYEQTKLEAEGLVGERRQAGLPIAIHRPSIIVGDARTGRASSFKVLYWPMKVYARGRFRTVFGRPDCPVDVVPVDFVADALLHLTSDPATLGGTFHLAAGPEGQSTIAALAALAAETFGRPPVRYVDPDVYDRWLRPVLRPVLRAVRPDVAERGAVYLPYLRSNPTFDTREARRALGGIAPPPVEAYFGRIMQYALQTNFGRA